MQTNADTAAAGEALPTSQASEELAAAIKAVPNFQGGIILNPKPFTKDAPDCYVVEQDLGGIDESVTKSIFAMMQDAAGMLGRGEDFRRLSIAYHDFEYVVVMTSAPLIGIAKKSKA